MRFTDVIVETGIGAQTYDPSIRKLVQEDHSSRPAWKHCENLDQNKTPF